MKKFSLIKSYNSNKLYVGVSIIFCTVILIAGVTIAYFTQSDSKKMEDLLTADIRDTLEYSDNKDYMRQGLIPAKQEVAKQAYDLTGENKCIDSYGYSACSVYQFNIKNIANVSQELIIDLAPTVNNFGNLYYMLYEIDEEGNSVGEPIPNKLDTLTEEMIQNSNIPSYNLAKEVILNPNSDKTYELVFFVNDTGVDQTLEDSGKTFGGTIKISSVTTGKYMVESFGEDCWKTELLSDGTYKLTEFYGIDNTFRIEYNEEEDEEELIYGENFGVINNYCAGYMNDDDKDGYYSIYVPSTIGGKEISTLGNELFSTYIYNYETDETRFQLNYEKINNVDIEEGITKIEDGCWNYCNSDGFIKEAGTFFGLGTDFIYDEEYENFELNISLPSTLTYIGRAAFAYSQIYNLTIPAKVEYIGKEAVYDSYLENLTIEDTVENPSKLKYLSGFADANLTSLTIPNSVTTIGDSAFSRNNISTLTIPNSVTTIGDNAFGSNNISTLTIPNSVTTIGDSAFGSNNISTLTISNSVTTIGNSAFYSNNISSLTIPASVTTIGNSAFSSNNISSLTIPNSVTTIGNNAFSSNNITSLTIPNSVTTIGGNAFGSNNISTLTIPNSVTTIGDSAFSRNNISTLTIPNSVTTIGGSAFSNNSNIQSLIFEEPNNNSKELTIGDYAFYDTNIKYLKISSRVKQNSGSFYNSNIESLTFSKDVTSIGDSAFYSNNISTLTIPSSVTSIGDSAFSYNKNLTTLTFEEGSQLTSIGVQAFEYCNLTYTDSNNPLVIPSSVTQIGSYAFYSYSNGTDGDPRNRYLNYIKFGGTLTAGNTDWYRLESNGGATKSILK